MAIIVPIVSSWNPQGLNRAITDIKRAEGAFNTFTAAAAGIGGVMASTGRAMTYGLTMPLALLSGATIKTAMDFEDSFGKIKGLVGVAGKDIGALQDAAKRLGPAYGQSANQAADALFYITSAGLRGNEAIAVLESSLKASAVGLGDVKTIADLVTSSVNAYGSGVLSAAQATDALTAAVRLGKIEPTELAGSIGQVLPLSSALGISFDEVGAAFAAMSRTGTDAATAATQLRGIMSGLTKVTPKAEKQLQEFGLSGEGLRKQIREQGLLSVLDTLTKTFGDNEVAIANVFGNVRALTGVLDLMGANADVTRQIFGEMADSTGILEEAFGVTAETTKFKLATAMADLKAIVLEIGEQLIPIFTDTVIPAIRDVATGIGNMVEKWKKLSPETQDAIVKFGLLAMVAGPILWIVGSLIKGIGTLAIVVKGLGTALMFLTMNPIGLMITGLVLLGLAIYALIKNWDEISAKVKESVNKMVADVKNLWESIKSIFGGIRDWFVSIGGNIVDGLKQGISNAWGGFKSWFTGLIGQPIQWAKDILKIKSPSKVFEGIGKQTIAGFIKGAEGMTATLEASMGSIAVNSVTSFDGAAGGGNTSSATYNINVNAGIGTDGAQVGREIVDAIRRFERASGPVFASA